MSRIENKFKKVHAYLHGLHSSNRIAELATELEIPYGTLINFANGRSVNPKYGYVHRVYEHIVGHAVESEIEVVKALLAPTSMEEMALLAGKTGIPFGTLFNIKYGRVKDTSRYDTVHALYRYAKKKEIKEAA